MTTQLAITGSESKAVSQIKKDGLPRYLARQANAARKSAISNHAKYIDPSGKGSSSLAGYSIFISSEIKKAFGCSVNEMTGNSKMIGTLTQLELDIVEIIEYGEQQKLLREEIRSRIIATIKLNKVANDEKQKIMFGDIQ